MNRYIQQLYSWNQTVLKWPQKVISGRHTTWCEIGWYEIVWYDTLCCFMEECVRVISNQPYWSINIVKWNFMQITEIWKRTLFKVGWVSWPRECMILNILQVCFNEIFGQFLYDVKMEWMCSKPILGHFPDWTYPRPTLPRLTHPRRDNSPTDTSPTWHFLDQTFPRAAISSTGHFSNWTFPWPDISLSGYLPDYTFPLPDFLNWLKLINS